MNWQNLTDDDIYMLIHKIEYIGLEQFAKNVEKLIKNKNLWDENRIDIIASNGNDGLHYE